jgi:dipeptidyl aminopeptidase/acylaminoacyl peptidase
VYRRARAIAGIGLVLLLAATAGPLSAQPPAKKVLTFAESDIWRTASPPVLSPDGAYAAYSVWPGEGDGESVVRHVASGKEYKFPRGGGAAFAGPKFTPDGKRVLLPLTPTKAELDKAKADKAKAEDMPQSSLAVVDLATGTAVDRFQQSGALSVGGEGAGFVVYRKPTRPEPGKSDGKTETPVGPMGGKGGGKFPGKGGGALPIAPPPSGAETFGTDLHIRDLASKVERTIADVSQFNLSKDGQLLVYTVASRKEETNGVYAVNPRSGGSAAAIKTGPGRYSGLVWDEKQTKLAFLYDDSAVIPANQAPPPRPAGTPVGSPVASATPPAPPKWRAFVWDRGAKPTTTAGTTVPVGATGGLAALIPAGLTVNATSVAPADEVLGPATPGQRPGWTFSGGSVNFSPDGTKLFVNTAPKREPAPPAAVGPPRPDDFTLEIWHWKDDRLQPMQKLQATADQARTYSAVVLLDTKQFRQLSDDTIAVSQPPSGSDWALGSDNRKYRHTTGYGLPLSDYSVVNVRTGEKKSVLGGFGGYSTPSPLLSPTGKHLLGFDGKDWFTISIPDGKKANLTANLKVKFFDEEDDHPGAPRPVGQPLWTADGKFVLVNDRYDIWKLAVDGSTTENLTKIGRAQEIHFTLLRVQAGDEFEPFRGIDLSKPQLLGAENLHTRDTGFYRLEPGAAQPKLLIMGARRYGQPTKAKNADVYLLTVQTFYDHPDYFATTPDFHELKRVTDINPKVREYNWGRAELVHFKSSDGVPLSGVLVKPENFDPSKKYPMIVYIYERESDTLHQFRTPSVTRGQVINPTFYASNGYLVLMPDIVYKIGMPGQSAIKCVLPAIQAVCDKGYVDEKAIGINGQSWGGYQIAYMMTQTDRFKAAVAGAPVSNMVSAYDGIRWGSGLTRQFQYEWSQSRIGATLWEAPMKFIENSPVFMADRVKTPLLMIHNDQDDAVPWYQGIEYYLALRRLEKECYLLNYNGQPHNLANRAAARDFSVRMFQFFEHHLRDKPAPEWMAKGVPYLDRDKEKEQWKKLFGPEKK